MNALQVALIACQIAGTVWPIVEPMAEKGIGALIADLRSKQSNNAKLSFAEIKAIADEHGVDLKRVFDTAHATGFGVAPQLPAGHMGASFGSFFSGLGDLFTHFRNWLADPQTAAAIANVEKVAVGLVCALASAAELSATIMSEVGADKSTAGTTNKIYVASSTICAALGGTLTGEKASNVTAVTSVSS